MSDQANCDEMTRNGADCNTLADRLQATIDFMEEHYSEAITREQLAAIAGLHPDYYTRVFKRHFACSPIRYLTKVRIRHAKSRLLNGTEPAKMIAYSLGFSDEFYFSRKFKSQVGLAPSLYVKRLRNTEKIASLNHLTTGHLLALGITPYAAVLNRAFQLEDKLSQVLPIGYFNPEMEKLMNAKPEIIVTRGNREEELSLRLRQLNQIAPTLKLDFEQDWRQHFQEIARAINKQREAADWMGHYEEKVLQMSCSIRKRIGSERILLLGINAAGELYIYGQRNLGSVLYQDLGLEIPEGVKNISHYQQVSLRQLATYEAERILLMSFQYDGKSLTKLKLAKEVERLFARAQWKQLPAVRQGKVFNLIGSGHLYTSYNPWSHNLLLDIVKQSITS
ncbi:AraC family transcriptional regulator [Robertmurraya sp. FSL W8-0741]|uniref:AraC family transcriptional regulator n=1 Tax=Robertmurraya sp. FSL W8-0741 TaxID=2954629 RepID=UPI0030F95DF0